MKNLCLILVVSLCGSLFAQTTPPMGIRDKTPQQKAFINARIVVSPEQTLDTGILVINNGLVVAIGEDVTIPAGTVVFDLKGKTIYPGFIDPFTEYGLGEVGNINPAKEGRRPVYEGRHVGATAWNDALHPERDWVEQFRVDDKVAKELLKLGFAVAQCAKMDGILRGRAFVALLAEGLPNELVLRPKAAHFASFDKGSSSQEYPDSQMGAIALLRQTFLDTDWYRVARAAYKKNPEQKMPETNSSIEALIGLESERFVFESPDELSLLRADRLAGEFSLDFVLVGSNREYEHLDEVKSTGRTIILPVNFPKAPETKTFEDELDVSLATLRHWERAPANAAAMEEANISFAFTSHGLEKRSDFLKNVRTAVKRGLSTRAAIAALTIVPAEICGITDRAGTLEVGKLANFFICDKDIFKEEATIYSTWTAGKMKEFMSLDQVDFRGDYGLELNDLKLTLVLRGKLTEFKGSIKQGDTTINIKDITVEADKLYFSARMDSFGIKGLARFVGRLKDEQLVGFYATPDNTRLPWSAILTVSDKVEPDSTDTDSDKGDPKKTEEFVSRLTYPNMAYGFEHLPQRENVLIKNATVWTCEGDDTPTIVDVLVKDGLFREISSDIKAASGVRVINAAGKHLTPGLIDEHSHVAISRGINEGTHAVTAEVRIGDVTNPDDINIYRALAGGTTILRSLHGSANPIGGQAQVIKLRWGSSSEEVKYAKAPPSIKFALGENVKQSNWGEQFTVRYPQSRMGVETIIRDALQAALEYEKAWDVYNSISSSQRQKTVPPRRELQMDALLDVIQSRMFITCHSYVGTEILMLIRLAEEYGFTVQTFTHVLEGYKVADEMAAHGSGGSCFSDWWAYKFEVYDAIPYNTCIMHDRGVVTCVNSDSPELGRRLNQEAAKSVMYCGMAPEEALKMVTINPAILLRVDEYVGSIKVGKEADFVIWNGNPLSVYSHPEQTWIDGKRYFDLAQDHRMREQVRHEKARLVQKVLTSKTDDKSDKDVKKVDDEYGQTQVGLRQWNLKQAANR